MDPGQARGPFAPPHPAVVGHRGARRRHAENTPAAFAGAVAEGATWVELDARLSADGVVVVHHDAHLPDGVALVERSAAELAVAGVARLADVLEGLASGVGVDLEVKQVPGEPDEDEALVVVDRCAALLAAAPPRPVVLSSFNPLVLLAAADRGVDVPRALLTASPPLAGAVEAAAALGCAGVFPHTSTDGLDAAGIAAAHDVGLAVMVWTVDDPPEIRRLAAAGVDAICCDDPAGAVAALGRTGP